VIKFHDHDEAVIKIFSSPPQKYPPVNIADQISAGHFSLSCHQLACIYGRSGPIIINLMEGDEGKISAAVILQD